MSIRQLDSRGKPSDQMIQREEAGFIPQLVPAFTAHDILFVRNGDRVQKLLDQSGIDDRIFFVEET